MQRHFKVGDPISIEYTVMTGRFLDFFTEFRDLAALRTTIQSDNTIRCWWGNFSPTLVYINMLQTYLFYSPSWGNQKPSFLTIGASSFTGSVAIFKQNADF